METVTLSKYKHYNARRNNPWKNNTIALFSPCYILETLRECIYDKTTKSPQWLETSFLAVAESQMLPASAFALRCVSQGIRRRFFQLDSSNIFRHLSV